MHKSDMRAISTKKLLVEISLFNGSSLFGKLCVPVQGRLTDVLNDDRDFVPVECADGSFVGLSKRAIERITLPSREAVALPYRGSDPYLILGVREDVSNEELKAAYYRLCECNHPDRIKGFGLGPDYEQLATQNMARINDAYAAVVRLRNGNGHAK
jgi:DnaJ-domain-containing protein 1